MCQVEQPSAPPGLPPRGVDQQVAGAQGRPAADAGLGPGDVIDAIDGAPPFVNGVPSQGAIDALNPPYPATTPDADTAPPVDRPHQAVTAMDKREKLRGLVIDVRGNGGGMPVEVARLLGAFEHDKPYAYDCDAAGTCTPVMPDAGVPILGVSLTVLTHRNCASACDAFTAAVRISASAP